VKSATSGDNTYPSHSELPSGGGILRRPVAEPKMVVQRRSCSERRIKHMGDREGQIALRLFDTALTGTVDESLYEPDAIAQAGSRRSSSTWTPRSSRPFSRRSARPQGRPLRLLRLEPSWSPARGLDERKPGTPGVESPAESAGPNSGLLCRVPPGSGQTFCAPLLRLGGEGPSATDSTVVSFSPPG
jgi:hypothetical protein